MNENQPEWYRNWLDEGIIYDESGFAIAHIYDSNKQEPLSQKTNPQDYSPKKED